MKFRNQARLCSAVFDFEVIVCLAYVKLFKVPDYWYEKTFNSNVAAKCEYIFSDFY